MIYPLLSWYIYLINIYIYNHSYLWSFIQSINIDVQNLSLLAAPLRRRCLWRKCHPDVRWTGHHRPSQRTAACSPTSCESVSFRPTKAANQLHDYLNLFVVSEESNLILNSSIRKKHICRCVLLWLPWQEMSRCTAWAGCKHAPCWPNNTSSILSGACLWVTGCMVRVYTIWFAGDNGDEWCLHVLLHIHVYFLNSCKPLMGTPNQQTTCTLTTCWCLLREGVWILQPTTGEGNTGNTRVGQTSIAFLFQCSVLDPDVSNWGIRLHVQFGNVWLKTYGTNTMNSLLWLFD